MGKLKNFFLDNRVFILLFISILTVYGISCYKRQADYWYWMENRQDYVVDHVTAMTTKDAYYWLKTARELDKGAIGKGKGDPRRGYPDSVQLAINDTPGLLTELISFGKNFTGGDYYRSGLMLVTILPGLFVFPLFFYFYRLGFGASSVLGGLVGSFSHAYYDRTMMGRLDTDLLNLFFPLAIACFILLLDKKKTWRANSLLAVGAGITMYLFNWWYQQPSFILVYLFIMAAYLLIGRFNWKQIALLLLLFLLLSGPDNVLQISNSVRTFLNFYIPTVHAAAKVDIVWPDIMQVISEVKSRSIEAKFDMLYGLLPMVIAGFAGLIYLYLRRFRQMIPITPLIALGAFALAGPARFLMYLSPLIGIGVGVLIELLVKFSGKKFRLPHLLIPATSIALMFTLFFSTASYTAFPTISAPTISAQTTKALLEIKSIVPKHSAMFTSSWGFGYALMEIGDFATYHDGGIQGGMRTTLTSKAMTSTKQKEIVSVVSYLEDNGFKGVGSMIRKGNITADKMMEQIYSYPGKFRGEKVYILYLEKMIWEFYSMSKFGTWDFKKKKSDPMDYVDLNCYSFNNNVITCKSGTIDLNRGYMDDGSRHLPLRGVLFVNNGQVTDQKYYPTDEGHYLQVLSRNNKISMVLVADERLFHTNFNQQFLLGNYDRRYFEEVYNNFPIARVLKVKKTGADDSNQ